MSDFLELSQRRAKHQSLSSEAKVRIKYMSATLKNSEFRILGALVFGAGIGWVFSARAAVLAEVPLTKYSTIIVQR